MLAAPPRPCWWVPAIQGGTSAESATLLVRTKEHFDRLGAKCHACCYTQVVLVVGASNSGEDISREVAAVAQRVHVSARTEAACQETMIDRASHVLLLHAGGAGCGG